MIIGGRPARCHCGHNYEKDSGTYSPHVCCGCTHYSIVERETCPDLSRLNRKDRRTMDAIAKRYGWKQSHT